MRHLSWSAAGGHLDPRGQDAAFLLLRKLTNYRCKNRLYQAFHALGCVVRTVFLLQFLPMRSSVKSCIARQIRWSNTMLWRIGPVLRRGYALQAGLRGAGETPKVYEHACQLCHLGQHGGNQRRLRSACQRGPGANRRGIGCPLAVSDAVHQVLRQL